jgi:lipopolysaccharide/colanic/teichoic acid biosynthesis glycosyltransferase
MITGPDRMAALVVKRILDVVVSALALVILSPIMLAVALLVRVREGPPVLFRQTRVGLHGRRFDVLKFRTMATDAEARHAELADRSDPRAFKLDDDPRITPTGRFLRRTSLDELPQLWNVVRGDMSIVGPRPTLRYQVETYDERQRHRLDVKPGITGWAQVNGRARLLWSERIELDLWYVENRSALLDLKILLRTPLALFGGTYKGETGGWKPAG